jgi:hypothetical protein
MNGAGEVLEVREVRFGGADDGDEAEAPATRLGTVARSPRLNWEVDNLAIQYAERPAA